MDYQAHWNSVYSTKATDDVSWYQERPELSLALIKGTGVAHDAAIIDVGAGASTLVDHLLADRFTNIALLDISDTALQVSRNRVGQTATHLMWLVGDFTTIALDQYQYDIWHDRAVFHFLNDPLQKEQYVRQVLHAVKPGGHVIIATFATDGPEKCSGLTTARYNADSLHAVFGGNFKLVTSQNELHHTPWGTDQHFIYCYCRKASSGSTNLTEEQL